MITYNHTCDICGALKTNSKSPSWGSLKNMNFPVRRERCTCPSTPGNPEEFKWRGPLFDLKDYNTVCEECQALLFTAVRMAYQVALAERLALKKEADDA